MPELDSFFSDCHLLAVSHIFLRTRLAAGAKGMAMFIWRHHVMPASGRHHVTWCRTRGQADWLSEPAGMAVTRPFPLGC